VWHSDTTYLAQPPMGSLLYAREIPPYGGDTLFANQYMADEALSPILAYLFQHQIRPEFTCRFVWRPGSLAFWDNRAAQHNPVNDYHGFRRVVHRITRAGDTPW
jgi:alpha-ketoglutarate-dependent taurine dioxygenase